MLRIVRAVSCHGAGVLIDIDLPAQHLRGDNIARALTD